MGRCRTFLLSIFLCAGIAAAPASGAIFYDIGAKAVYDDNVVGLLSDGSGGSPSLASGSATSSGKALRAMGNGPGSGMGPGSGTGSGSGSYLGSSTEENSDLFIDITAELGASARWGDNTSFFLSGGAERISYNEFTEFNMTAGGVTAGMVRQFGSRFAARITANAVVKRFEEEERDATAYGGGLLLKQFLTPAFWLKESAGYERNEADAVFFTYTGTSFALGAGFAVTDGASLDVGFSHLVRAYDDPDGFEETANMYWLGLDWEFIKKWFLGLQYERRYNDTTLPETDTIGNIYTLGLRYSY